MATDWFENSSGNLLFAWSTTQPEVPAMSCLVGGNRNGYLYFAKALEKLLSERDKGAQRRVISIPVNAPKEGPAALLYTKVKPNIGRDGVATLSEIEAYYRKTQPAFGGFHWFGQLRCSVSPGTSQSLEDLVKELEKRNAAQASEQTSKIPKGAVCVDVSWEHVETAIHNLKSARFPQEFSIPLFSAADSNSSVLLACEWLGLG